MAASSGSGGGLMTEINVTPLVDVVLVLLVLMMVTATALVDKSIPVQLPHANGGEATNKPKKPFQLGVDAEGRLLLEQGPVEPDVVRARARAAIAADADTAAVLAADGRAHHEAVVKALELLRGERVSKIAIVVRSETR